MKQGYKENNLLFFILIIIALEAILFSIGNFKLNNIFLNEENKITRIQNILAGIPVQAKAFSIYDVDLNREIYGKDQNEPLPLASLVKTMTVIVALANHKPGSIIVLSPGAINQAGDYGLFANEKWKMEDLAKFTLIGSANDGAYALFQNKDDFLNKMNSEAKKIGMENALFLNPTGLDINNLEIGLPMQAGAYASALDANIMAIYALKARPDIFSATILPEINLKSESGFNHNIKNTDIVLHKIPNLYFSKTGFTNLTGGNLTIIFKNKIGHEIAVTVLGSTLDGRFSDIENLVNVLY